jgi:small neutral amino acid transporter SnatA (MarC family)
MQDWRTNAEIATSLLVIADPIATIPIFITLTTGQTARERKRTASVTALTVAIVLVLSISSENRCWNFSESGSPRSGWQAES